MSVSFRNIIETQLRFLFFRPIRVSLQGDFAQWLGYVLVVTWLVGVGRYWDHPSAMTFQYLGLGSVAYIFSLATLVFLVVWPLGPANWSFHGVVVFVGLTSLPALLYAIPVERFMSLERAQAANAGFLAIVALWRVALFLRYLHTVALLHWFVVLTVATLLLSGIVFALALLNLEHVVFDLMAGIRPEDASPNDTAYLIVFGLAFWSLFAFPAAAVVYLGCIVYRVTSKPGRRAQ
ncbi:MAG: hypothetical protein QNJ00_01835 [Woeseiaceae bacterium]|nr:hypothetical protein [Woeseiaceae bacterium]